MTTTSLLKCRLVGSCGLVLWGMTSSYCLQLPHWKLYPKTYVANRTPAPFLLDRIDGNLNKPEWQNVEWSDPFDDIQGRDAPKSEKNQLFPPPAMTRFKAMYDNDYLYIGAILHPAVNLTTQAHFTRRNEPIYQKDSDFEVFVDTDGSNQYYKELEVNALNTVWNLMLDKPYSDGGREHSGRIAKPGDALFYEVYHQKTAVRVLEGRLNDDDSNPPQGALWSVEMALAFSDLNYRPLSAIGASITSSARPSVGSRWRINFSRVERQGQINWTWQSQYRWDPSQRRYVGKIDMHLPDAWGYLVFGSASTTRDGNEVKYSNDDSSSKTAYDRDPTWPARLTAMTLYYAEHYHFEQTGSFTSNISDLIVPFEIVDPFQVELNVDEKLSRFVVTASRNDVRVQVTDDRSLSVQSISSIQE